MKPDQPLISWYFIDAAKKFQENINQRSKPWTKANKNGGDRTLPLSSISNKVTEDACIFLLMSAGPALGGGCAPRERRNRASVIVFCKSQ
jgi:hypothetical protein